MNHRHIHQRLRGSLLVVVAIAVGGCAIKPVHFDGKSATYTHYESDFASAMVQAREMCRAEGKGVKHESTACTRTLNCVSTFLCMNQ